MIRNSCKIIFIFFEKAIDKIRRICYNVKVSNAGMAQSVEHVIGNDEVISSILITSSKNPRAIALGFFHEKA